MHETPRALKKTYQLRSYPANFLHASKNVSSSRRTDDIPFDRAEKWLAESVAFAGEAD
jgi:hypothetical protein